MRIRMYADFSYLIVLAATLGAVMILGVVVAPVVFKVETIMPVLQLDHYSSGLLMGEIFRRFSFWLYAIVIFVALYEVYWYKMGQRDLYLFVSSVFVIFTSLMFSSVYTPKILEMQALGNEATLSDTFKNVHIASEIDFKILALSLLVLFIRRLMLLQRA